MENYKEMMKVIMDKEKIRLTELFGCEVVFESSINDVYYHPIVKRGHFTFRGQGDIQTSFTYGYEAKCRDCELRLVKYTLGEKDLAKCLKDPKFDEKLKNLFTVQSAMYRYVEGIKKNEEA